MKKQDLINAMRSGLFSDRPTLGEAAKYAQEVVAALPTEVSIYAWTAIGVLLNTIANEIEKLED